MLSKHILDVGLMVESALHSNQRDYHEQKRKYGQNVGMKRLGIGGAAYRTLRVSPA